MSSEKRVTTWTFDKPCYEMEVNELHKATLSVNTTIDDGSDLIIFGLLGPKEASDASSAVLTGTAKEFDDKLGGALAEAMAENLKSFKDGSSAGSTTPTIRVVSAGEKTKRVILLGLGTADKDLEGGLFAKIGKSVATACDSNKKVKTCTVVLPESVKDINFSDLATEFYSSLYSDNRYRTGDKIILKAEDLESVSIVVDASVDVTSANASIESGKVMASGLIMTKDIVNAPHNALNSESLANTAKKIAEESGGTLTCKILDKDECEKRGMGAYLAVARGSETDPQFIHMTYTPKSGKVSKKLGVVGKGLLFDTGGYNIKVGMMELMKFDCGGSAAVLGAAKAIGKLEPENVEIHFIVAACENMVNEKAYVPSDILTASNGVTIEVLNTDAEGRLTMADALVYADKEVGCDSIIELSTLTGSCMIALGKDICGVWTSDDDLAKDLEESSKVTGDKSWRMPLVKEYNDQLKSKIADITNCGTRYGGSITAALFLNHFVDEKKPFAHIDIAGPVWDDKSGATGFGAKLVTEWVSSQGKKE
jgi:leucyl aminopeptidase